MSEPKIEPWMEKAAAEIMSVWRGNVMPFNEQSMAKIILEHAPSSPAAPTPHANAEEFRKTYTGDPLVIGNAMDQDAVYRFAEALAASETARADRAEQDRKHNVDYWKQRYESVEADLQRKDAALAQAEWDRDFLMHRYKLMVKRSLFDTPLEQIEKRISEAALAPISVPAAPEVTPSPCCANPNMVVKGMCDGEITLHLENQYKFSLCKNWRPTHSVCLSCGKEEKI